MNRFPKVYTLALFWFLFFQTGGLKSGYNDNDDEHYFFSKPAQHTPESSWELLDALHLLWLSG